MSQHTRLTIAVLALVALAGCMGATSSDGDGATIEYVPAEADGVVQAQASLLTADETTELADLAADEDPAFDGLDSLIAEFEEETGLDPTDFTELSFYEIESEDAFGSDEAGVIEAGWDEDDLVDALEADTSTELVESEYNGVTFYEPADEDAFGTEYLAVPEDGVFVIGDRPAVEAAADVAAGDNDGVSDDLQSALADESGHVSMAFEVPEESVPGEAAPGEIDTEPLEDVAIVSGSYDTSDGAIVLSSTMYATSSSAAQDIEDVVDGATSFAAGMAESDELADEARSITVDRDDDVVTIGYDLEIDRIEELVDELEEEFAAWAEPGGAATGEPVEPDDEAFGEPIEPATP